MTTRPGIDRPLDPPPEERGRSGLRRTASGRPPDPLLAAGTVVAGRFRIVEAIGQGGMGTVYRAEQIPMRREVALKIMHGGGASTVARFEREAQAASRITSPHVVTIHDFGEGQDGILYLAMELLQGESLGQRILRRGALPVSEAVAIAIQIGRALAVAHAAGVIHRDLKPDNIHLVTDDGGAGQVKVLDFGIARLVHGDAGPTAAHLTSADLVVGTPLYMSPEACSRGQVGPGADLYSLGVILFEMITGRPPFEEREPVLVMSRHLEAKPPRMRERRPDLDIPPALDDVVDRLLRKKPADRYPSATALLEALRRVVDSTARITAPPRDAIPIRAEPTVVETREPARRPVGATIAIVAGTILAAVLAALVIAVALRPDEPPVTATELAPLAPPPIAAAAPVAPAPVRIQLEITPDDAVASLDGAPVAGRALELPRDGARHVLEISAPGHDAQRVEVVGDADRVVAVDLAPSPSPRPGRTPRARRAARPTQQRRDPLMREW